MSSKKLETVRSAVRKLHDESADECMREWFYEGHVEVVAKHGREIATALGVNSEVVELGALLHDIARTWGIQKDPDLMEESFAYAEKIMTEAAYSEEEIQHVRNIISTHGCKEDMPTSEEGKVLATADALAHLMTDFYFILPFEGWLTAADTYEGYRSWLLAKIERDFHRKIFYTDHQSMAKPRYESFKTLFTRD